MRNQEKYIKSQWHLRCNKQPNQVNDTQMANARSLFPIDPNRQAVTSAWGKTSDDNSGTQIDKLVGNAVANCSNWRKVLRLFNQWFTALARLRWYFFPIQCDGAHGDPSVSMALGHSIGPTEPSKLVQLIQAKKGPKVKVPQKFAANLQASHGLALWAHFNQLVWRGPWRRRRRSSSGRGRAFFFAFAPDTFGYLIQSAHNFLLVGIKCSHSSSSLFSSDEESWRTSCLKKCLEYDMSWCSHTTHNWAVLKVEDVNPLEGTEHLRRRGTGVEANECQWHCHHHLICVIDIHCLCSVNDLISYDVNDPIIKSSQPFI